MRLVSAGGLWSSIHVVLYRCTVVITNAEWTLVMIRFRCTWWSVKNVHKHRRNRRLSQSCWGPLTFYPHCTIPVHRRDYKRRVNPGYFISGRLWLSLWPTNGDSPRRISVSRRTSTFLFLSSIVNVKDTTSTGQWSTKLWVYVSPFDFQFDANSTTEGTFNSEIACLRAT